MSADPGLWDRAVASNTVMPGLRPNGRVLTIQERFEAWLASPDGQRVASYIALRALDLHRRGFTHWGIHSLWELARYDGNLRVGPEGSFRLNDHFTSRMARHLMRVHPELASFFELRELRA